MNQIISAVNKTLIITGLLIMSPFSSAIKLSVNGSAAVELSDNVNLDTVGDSLQLLVEKPIVCHTVLTSLPSSTFVVDVIDPNGDGVSMPLLGNISYDIFTKVVNADINNQNSACVTKDKVSYGDVIFRTDFDVNEFSYSYLPTEVTPGQTIDYKIIIKNRYYSLMNFDLKEYAPLSSVQNQAYFDSVDFWDCDSHNGSTVNCNGDTIDNELTNASIANGYTAEIDVSRTVSSNAAIGSTVELLTAAYVKDQSGKIVDVMVLSHEANVVNNSAPVLSWLNAPSVSLVEDQTQATSLTFVIDDSTGVNVDVSYLQQAITSANGKLTFSNVSVSQNLVGNFEVTFDVVPVADAFTDQGNPESILIQVEDDFGLNSNQLALNVDITPINDPPSFNISCDHIVVNPTPGVGESNVGCASQSTFNQVYTDFLANLTPGPNESSQLMSFQFLNLVDSNGILNSESLNIINSSPNMQYDDLLFITNSGTSGTATFEVKATDSGGLQGNGCNGTQVGDGCDTFVFGNPITIELLNPTFTISGVATSFPGGVGDKVFLKLTVNGAVEVTSFEVDASNANGFTLDYRLEEGDTYLIEKNGYVGSGNDCEIQAGGSGVMGTSDLSDLVLDCSAN